MPDNWGFVAAAYGVAALVLGGYWRYLRHSEGAIHGRAPSGATAPSETSPRKDEDRGGKAAARTSEARPR